MRILKEIRRNLGIMIFFVTLFLLLADAAVQCVHFKGAPALRVIGYTVCILYAVHINQIIRAERREEARERRAERLRQIEEAEEAERQQIQSEIAARVQESIRRRREGIEE